MKRITEGITSNWMGKSDMTGKNGIGSRSTDHAAIPKVMAMLTVAVMVFAATAAQGAFFDTAGQTARPMGMGEVFLATRGDAASYWYNPAGLSAVDGGSLGLSYGIINPSISSDLMKYQLTYARPLAGGGLGLGISGFGADGANEFVISGAYGFALGERLSLGANVKVMRWAIEGQADPYTNKTDDDLSKLSFSLDLSGAYSLGSMFGLDDLTTGVYVRDAIMPNISESGDDGGQLPIEIGVGLMGEMNNILAEIDVAFVDGQTIFRGGVESPIAESPLVVRAGMIYGSDFEDDVERTDFDFGVGYTFIGMVFDYAYNLPIALSDSGGRHFVSFGVSF